MTSGFTNRRGFLYAAGALSAVTLFDSCSKAVEPTPTPTPTPVLPTIAAWGDSLTAGSGGTPYPTQLATLLPNRKIVGYGIGGQVAAQIAARQGSLPVTLTVQGNAFSGTAAVPVTGISTALLSTISNNNTYTLKGTVAGVACTLTRTATGTQPKQVEVYTLTPTVSSTQAIPANSVFISDEAVSHKTSTQVLWLGRNNTPNFEGVDATIQGCVDYLANPKQYIVIGVLNGLLEIKNSTTYNKVIAFNTLLAGKHGTNFIPATPPTDAEMSAVSYTPTAQDKIDLTNETFPKGLRSDDYHLNTLGYQIIANRVAAKLKEKGF